MLINASRSILYASNKNDFAQAARAAAINTRDAINRLTTMLGMAGSVPTRSNSASPRIVESASSSETPPPRSAIEEITGASLADPRFASNRISKDELRSLTIEISVLTEPKPTKKRTPKKPEPKRPRR